jgi:hypothetical protein
VKQAEPRFAPVAPPPVPEEEEPSVVAYSVGVVVALALIGVVFAVIKFAVNF